MRLAEYRSLLAHMEWADAATWKTATGLAGARQDAQIPDRLYHLHSVHWVYLRPPGAGFRLQAPDSGPVTEITLMEPRDTVSAWVDAFNRADVEALAALYAEDAVNHQVPESPVEGREAIRAMFAAEFARADMRCIVEHIFQDGDWAILEWRDPLGLRGCGFFRIEAGRIAFQRGYWDKLSFLRQHGLPAPD